jgi:hypothetical protein
MSRRRGARRRSNAKRFLKPGPSRTYETTELAAGRSLGHVLNDEETAPGRHRRRDAEHRARGRGEPLRKTIPTQVPAPPDPFGNDCKGERAGEA